MKLNSVSVVMPVYNGERFIAESIESALNQIDCVVELIVVDDGSTDCTPAIVATFGDRVRYVRQNNAGPAAARNLGIRLATHDWVAFLDADDLWNTHKLAKQLHLAGTTQAQLVYTNTRNFGHTGVAELRCDPEVLPSGDVYHNLLQDNFVTLSSVLVRRELLTTVGGFRTEFRGTEDWDLWLRIAAMGVELHPVREPLTHYRWLNNSLSKSHSRMKELRDRTLNCALDNPGVHRISWGEKRRARANALATSALFCESSSPRSSQRWYRDSLLSWPFSWVNWKALVRTSLRRMWNPPPRPTPFVDFAAGANQHSLAEDRCTFPLRKAH